MIASDTNEKLNMKKPVQNMYKFVLNLAFPMQIRRCFYSVLISIAIWVNRNCKVLTMCCIWCQMHKSYVCIWMLRVIYFVTKWNVTYFPGLMTKISKCLNAFFWILRDKITLVPDIYRLCSRISLIEMQSFYKNIFK